MIEVTIYDDAYISLANAIIIQAAKDYMRALKHLARNPKDQDIRNKLLATKSNVERFFRSEWYSMLTDVDSKTLLTKLKAEVKR